MFGPLFLRKDGAPLKNQPVKESDPAWGPFLDWYGKQPKDTK